MTKSAWNLLMPFVAGSALLAVAVMASVTQASQSHGRGSRLYPPQVAAKLRVRGYESAVCSGRGRYRWTNWSRPDNLQTWQYRHFECYSGTNPPIIRFICVHSLPLRRIFISRVMIGNDYRRYRF